MPFLSINGWAVPVESGSFSKRAKVDGDTTRPFSGGKLSQNQISIKDGWRGSTKVQRQSDNAALRGLLLGQGDHWALSGSPFTSGLGQPEVPTTVAPVEISVAAGGGDPVFEAAKFSQAVRVAPATTNLADNRDLDAVSVVLTGASSANDATNFINGSGSRKITFLATGGTSRVKFVAFSSPSTTTDYTASIYIRGDGSTALLKVFLQEDTGPSGPDTFVTLKDGVWQHIENITITTSGALASLDLVIEEVSVDSLAVFEMDAFQIEQKEYSTTFLDSASARAVGKLKFDAGLLTTANAGLTAAFWTRGPNLDQDTGARNTYLFAGAVVANVWVYTDSGTNNLQLETQGMVSPATRITYATTPWDGLWHHVAIVIRYSPETGDANRELYFDGALVASDSPGVDELPDVATMAAGDILIGNAGGASESNAPIEDMVIMPYPASASMVAAFAAYSRAQTDFPLLLAEGDFDSRLTVDVMGAPLGADFTEGTIDDVFRSNSTGLTFELDEA